VATLIRGLTVLRAEFDAVNPGRDHTSDGWIGDQAHLLRISDHNPDAVGIVHAIDVDTDGVPMARIVAYLAARCKSQAETRLQYIIYRRIIWSHSWGWTPRIYTGLDPHTGHAHFSSRYTAAAGGSEPWGVAATFGPGRPDAEPPKPPPPVQHPPGRRRLQQHDPLLSGADVTYVQHWIGSRQCGPADGRYGPNTAAGVRWYQRMRGLAVDGIVGPRTWRNMGVRWAG
jgi:peptidoglycan hydrolase-like protein with peptidoglycan-binding domain